MTGEEAILKEAGDELMEAARRITAIQDRFRAADLDDRPDYRELSRRLALAFVAVEAVHMEVRRKLEQGI